MAKPDPAPPRRTRLRNKIQTPKSEPANSALRKCGWFDYSIRRFASPLNSYWFPNQYLTIGEYLKENGQSWKKVDPKKILGKDYSSIQRYDLVSSKVKNLPPITGGGACGV